MFERFTDSARRVIVLAQDEARMLNHNWIGTEHILLGLIREKEGAAAQTLESFGVPIEAVRERVNEMVGPGSVVVAGHIPFTPRAKKVLELSLREAQQLGDTYIGTEHLLLGLIREGEGLGAQVLQGLDADLSLVRSRVIEMATGEAASDREDPVLCPRCDSDLAESAFYRTITVPEEGERAARPVSFVFCRRCSLTLGIIPAD